MIKEREYQLSTIAKANANHIHYSLAYLEPLTQSEIDLMIRTIYNNLMELNGLEGRVLKEVKHD